MEVNKDEALRCLDIARRHLSTGNYSSARKFALKSIALFPTPEGEAFVLKVASEESSTTTTASSSTESTSKTKSSSSSESATSSARPNSTATPLRSRSTPVDHKPVERDYTSEQAAAVKNIRSSGGDFYKVLGVQKDASDTDIKKAYRKLALQMHPDKNGAPGADEAFKIVSKAFTVLSDPQKRAVFDQHGPDDGRGSSVNYDRASPSAQHFRNGRRGEEVSPEELFNMFFGGGGGFRGGSFQTASAFAGDGSDARSRARQAHYQQQYRQHFRQQRQQRPAGTAEFGFGNLIQLMPVILLIVVTMFSGLFSSDWSSSNSTDSNPIVNDFSLRPRDQFTTARHTSTRNVPYFVNEVRFMNTYFPGQQFEFKSPGSRQIRVKEDHVTQGGRRVGPLFKRMEENVEISYLRDIQGRCKEERRRKDVALNKAMGFWGADRKMWQEAQRMTMPSCEVIKEKYGKQYIR
ncbi:hypothetical protein BGZ99_001284 [Dissophora globulifera]|uniref:J domain-containing protein n=1 Tax=Dissophora globulifera TaxID=979702 RepID=A0A9P6RPU6_9FUNG|nr:hypothetical protein BGZ99_001284 [Dissophora globulifera]